MAYTIIDADKSQVRSRQLESQECQWCKSNLNSGRLEIQEESIFQLESKGRKKGNNLVQGTQGGRIPLAGK